MNMNITQHNTTHSVIKHLVQNLDWMEDSNAKYHLIYTDHERIKLLPLNSRVGALGSSSKSLLSLGGYKGNN